MRISVRSVTYYVAEVWDSHGTPLASCGHQHPSHKSAVTCAKKLKASLE